MKNKPKWLIKIGGSLRGEIPSLAKIIVEAHKTDPLLIVPGGSVYADFVRLLDKRLRLGGRLSHRLATLGMDYYGRHIAEKIPSAIVVREAAQIGSAIENGKIPVFLPFGLLLGAKKIPPLWDAASDSISAYIARRLKIRNVVFCKDTDGVMEPGLGKKVYRRISPADKAVAECLDPFFKNVYDPAVAYYVINGKKPDRLLKLVNGEKTTCTFVELSAVSGQLKREFKTVGYQRSALSFFVLADR